VKILLDTNIILDIALARQPFFGESEQVLSLVEQGEKAIFQPLLLVTFTTLSVKLKVEIQPWSFWGS